MERILGKNTHSKSDFLTCVFNSCIPVSSFALDLSQNAKKLLVSSYVK